MSEDTISSYRDRILNNAKMILRNVVTNSAPVFGVISPPFTDVEPFCRKLIRYMFEKRAKIKYGKKEVSYHLYALDPTLPEVGYEQGWKRDELLSRVFKTTDSDPEFIEGVFLKHLELITDEHWDIILNEADKRGMFILYNSPHQKERGQYISSGLLSDEDALAHFEEPGYIHKGEIPPELVSEIPHNEYAIRIVEQELLNHGGGDITQNADILINWREYIRPYIDETIVRDRLKILFNIFLNTHKGATGKYFDDVRDDKALGYGPRERFKDDIGCILRSIVFTSTSAPNEFLDTLWTEPGPKYHEAVSNDFEVRLGHLRMGALKALRDNRLVVLQDGRYNTTPYVAEVLKKYFRFEVAWHLKTMTEVIGKLRDNLETMVECEFPLNLIEEGIRAAVSFHGRRASFQGIEYTGPKLDPGKFPTLTLVGNKAEFDAHIRLVFGDNYDTTVGSEPVIRTCVDLLEDRNLIYAGTPAYGRCLRILNGVKGIDPELRKRVLRLTARYHIYYDRSNLANSTAVIKTLKGDDEYRFIAAELVTCSQLRVPLSEMDDMPGYREIPLAIYEDLKRCSELEGSIREAVIGTARSEEERKMLRDHPPTRLMLIQRPNQTGRSPVDAEAEQVIRRNLNELKNRNAAHIRAYNYFILKALDNLSILSKGSFKEKFKQLFDALEMISRLISFFDYVGSACDLEYRVIHQQCERRRANALNNRNDKTKEYCEHITDLERFKRSRMLYPGLYLKANMENSWYYMDSNDTFHARTIYESVQDLLSTGMLAGEREFNLANYYQRTGMLFRARDHYLSSVEYYTREGLIDFAVSAKCSLMTLYAMMNDYDSIRGLRVELEAIVKEGEGSRFNDALLRRIQRTLHETYF